MAIHRLLGILVHEVPRPHIKMPFVHISPFRYSEMSQFVKHGPTYARRELDRGHC